jgi:hypothetical protein
VMREEAPELTESPSAEPPTAAQEAKPAAIADAGPATRGAGFAPDAPQSNSVGLKPPPASSPGLGMRQPESGGSTALAREERTADRLAAEATAPVELAKRRDAPALVREQGDSRPAPASPPAPAVAGINAQKDSTLQPPVVAAPAGNAAEKKPQFAAEPAAPARTERESRFREAPAPAPALDKATVAAQSAPDADTRQAAAKVAPRAAGVMGKLESDTDLPPEKWLERIEELRKQGKVEEAKANLAEFRKRFPNYKLPDALRAWSNP